MRDRLKALLARTFRVPEGSVADDAAMGVLPEWDSVGHLELMLAVEMEFGVQLTTDAILELLSLEALEEYLCVGQGLE